MANSGKPIDQDMKEEDEDDDDEEEKDEIKDLGEGMNALLSSN